MTSDRTGILGDKVALHFPDRLIVEAIGKNRWRLVHSFRYMDEIKFLCQKVPWGFETDFASIPRIFWNIISPVDKHARAAVLHDYMYFTGEYPKELADRLFYYTLKILGVKRWKRKVMFLAVKYFGGFAWRKHRKNDKQRQ